MGAVDVASGKARERRKRGWFWIHNDVNDVFGPVMGPAAIAVYASLVRRANETGDAVVSVARLATDTGQSASAVRRAVAKLERLRLVTVVERVDQDGGQRSSEYLIEEPPERVPPEWSSGPRPGRRVEVVGQGGKLFVWPPDTPRLPYQADTPPCQGGRTPLATGEAPPVSLTGLEEDPREEDPREEGSSGVAMTSADVQALVRDYVAARSAGWSDAALAAIEAGDMAVPPAHRGLWERWSAVASDRGVRLALRDEKRRMGAAW